MRFLLDHDVPAEVAHVVRHWAHEVKSLRQAECARLLHLLGRAGEAGLANNINFA